MRYSPSLHIVLHEPEIPPNAGNIGRTCVAIGAKMWLVEPLGFTINDYYLRRAGLDYWHELDVREHDDWDSFLDTEQPNRLWLFTTKSTQPIWDASFQRGDYLLFGCEQHGVPKEVHDWVEQTQGDHARLVLPMIENARSLNLATAVCAAVYEGFRQISY